MAGSVSLNASVVGTSIALSGSSVVDAEVVDVAVWDRSAVGTPLVGNVLKGASGLGTTVIVPVIKYSVNIYCFYVLLKT